MALGRAGPHQFCLTQLLAHEQCRLPEGYWELVFENPEDEAVLTCVAEDGAETISDPDQYLRQTVFVDPVSQAFWLVGGKFKPDDEAWSLSVEMVKHRTATVALKVGASGFEVQADVAIFRRRRSCGLHAYWKINNLYKMLGLASFGKQASKWFGRSVDRWSKLCAETFGADQEDIVWSCSHPGGDGKESQLP